ncbi:MAG: site-specific integrase [Pirellulales bacterium]
MPRLVSQMPRYRKHRASGQAIVELGGRVHYLGPHGTRASRIEYDRLVMEWIANGRFSLPTSEPYAITVTELCQRYRKFAKSYYQKGGKPTCVAAIKSALKLARIHYGKTLAGEFGPLALKSIRQRMIDQGWSRRYINDQVDRIRRMFKWAVGEQLLPVEVHQSLAVVPGLRRGRSEADPVKPVEAATVDATLAHLPDVVADMVRVQRFTGCRPAELCQIRPCDVDQSGEVWQFRPKSHKTEHAERYRVVFIGPQAQSVLLRYLARDHQAYCFRPQDSEAKRRAVMHATRKTPLSCGNRPGTNRSRRPKRPPGEAYTAESYRRAIHRACDKAFPAPEQLAQRSKETERAWNERLTDAQRKQLAEWQSAHRWSPNQLRHAAATEIRKQFGLEAAQVLLGHATANVTQIYAERDLAKGVEVARKIG